jgi:BON domain-containing protein
MAESLFGTVSPVWSTLPFPGVTWPQAPLAANRTVGSGPGSVALNAGMLTGSASPGFGPVAPPGPPLALATPVGPVFTPEMAGITAPALVMTVALRRGQLSGPTSDPEIEDFLYDAVDLLPGTSDVEIRCDSGRATLAGTVSQKRLKRDVGEIAWAIPSITDVQNNITIAPRRRSRASSREPESSAVGAARKPA